MLDDRKLDVLRAIVEDYVATQEPVGSKALVERHTLGVSPATIRNDMAALEEEGYIAQPHTSAGRIPTDKGYRLFVDRLSGVKPLSAGRAARHPDVPRRAPSTSTTSSHRTVRLLAQLTRQVAVVQYPSLTRSTVRHVELVTLAPTRLLLVLITEHRPGRAAGGRAARAGRARRCSPTSGPGSTRPSSGCGSPTRPRASSSLPDGVRPRRTGRSWPASSPRCSRRSPTSAPRSGSSSAGPANLTRFGDGLPGIDPAGARGARGAGRAAQAARRGQQPERRLTVRIGHENAVRGAAATSVVATGYGPGEEALAKLGILGPTRMDYPGTMGAVRAVARYVRRYSPTPELRTLAPYDEGR